MDFFKHQILRQANFSDVKRNCFLGKIIFILQVCLVHAFICGSEEHVQRGDICCKPVFNCPPGNEIIPCSEMYDPETCQKCQPGFVQPDMISSLNVSRECFRKQAECTGRDLTYSRERTNFYPKHCKCNIAACFYEQDRVCIKAEECPVNMTLDPRTGECISCPTYTYKKHSGCSPCLTDIEGWRNSFAKTSGLHTTSRNSFAKTSESYTSSHSKNNFTKMVFRVLFRQKPTTDTSSTVFSYSVQNSTTWTMNVMHGVNTTVIVLIVVILLVVTPLTVFSFIYYLQKEKIKTRVKGYKEIKVTKKTDHVDLSEKKETSASQLLTGNVNKCPVHGVVIVLTDP